MAGDGNNRSMKDKMMAAHLKKLGVSRTTMRCPICPRIIGMSRGALESHFNTGCKPRRKGERDK